MTIWFQNKRQTRRKEAAEAPAAHTPKDNRDKSLIAHEFMAGESLDSLEPSPSRESSFYTSGSRFPRGSSPSSSSKISSSLYSSASSRLSRQSARSEMTRPTLDRVASRSEHRPLPPSTPERERHSNSSSDGLDGDIWDRMASSPLAPNNSPLARDLVAFGTKRNLEWACAKNRIARKEKRLVDEDGDAIISTSLGTVSEAAGNETDTEDESVEAVTPNGSIGALRVDEMMLSGPRLGTAWKPNDKGKAKAAEPPSINLQDDETMDAAIALCGLGGLGGFQPDRVIARPWST